MAKQATIREVAKLAGVSIATASRALNNPDYPVDARLRQKVRDAADKLQYVPNVMAQALRRDSCHDIGLVIPNVSNPFYLQTMLGINNVLAQQSYQMILCNTMRNAEQERSYLRQLYERQTKGIIISTVDESCDVIKEYARRGMKFVLLDQLPEGPVYCRVAFIDYRRPPYSIPGPAGDPVKNVLRHVCCCRYHSTTFCCLPSHESKQPYVFV